MFSSVVFLFLAAPFVLDVVLLCFVIVRALPPTPACIHMSPDTIDKWDEEKLKEVVEKKHGEKSKPKTDIVSQRKDLHLTAKRNGLLTTRKRE